MRLPALVILSPVFYFNPRTHRGVRQGTINVSISRIVFQSTHPSWGATGFNGIGFYRAIHFNPRTHRGVRLTTLVTTGTMTRISIHAPIVGCDLVIPFKLVNPSPYFNPRTHRGVRPYEFATLIPFSHISIHAPIVGCDLLRTR